MSLKRRTGGFEQRVDTNDDGGTQWDMDTRHHSIAHQLVSWEFQDPKMELL